jgi:hypothetical protein
VARAEYRLDDGEVVREGGRRWRRGMDVWPASSSRGGPRTGNSRKQNNGLTGSQLSSASS